jgi:cardiolipin synthase
MSASPWFSVGEDSVRHLRDGTEIYRAMLDAIDAAKHEVLVEMYWVGAGKVGTKFREALTARARAGVRVRVLYDSLGSVQISPGWWRPLVEAGGEVVEYHAILPFRGAFKIDHVVQRDHRKLIVVDGTIGFAGGANLSDEWLPEDDGGAAWRDDAIAVRGPAASDLRGLFYFTWRRVTKSASPRDVAPLPRTRARPVFVLASQRRRRRSIHREYQSRIANARRSIDIANAYFMPDLRLRNALYRAVDRGVRVRVLVPKIGDVPVVQFAVEALFDSLLKHGVELYAYGDAMLHSKTAIVDERFVTIGSYNLDERSWRKNIEANVGVEDEAFARHVTESFERDLARSDRVNLDAWRARPTLRRGAEWLAFALRELW